MSSAEEEAWTIGRLLGWTTDFLKRHGFESPRLEAEILLAHALGWPRVKLYMNINEEVGSEGRAQFRDLVKKRSGGTPVAYLVGHKEFYSLDFEVSPDVLIPRPDTETLVMTFLELAKPLGSPLCVDVGTGSGCIAIACTKHHASARFIAIDQSEKALAVATRNIQKQNFGDRIEPRQGSLLEPLKSGERPRFVVSNPPYIPSEDIAKLDKTVREYEPISALDGGPDGLRLVRPLISQAADVLEPCGYLLIEVGQGQAEPLQAEFKAHTLWHVPSIRKDLAGIPRVVVFQRI